jgi:TPR repeat protein
MQKKDTSVKVCGFCESAEGSEHKLQTCSRCRLVAYCSKACQAAHWKNGHKQACVAVQDRKPDSLNNNQHAREGNNKTDVVCVICLEPLKPSSSCTLPCDHSFHGGCVSNLRSQAASQVCPLCRTDLPPGPEQAYSECMKLFYGVINKTSKNESEDMLEAVKLGTYAAEEGNVDAQLFLGVCFSRGLGVLQDFKMVFHWYMKAAEQGDPVAQYNVACCHVKGEGVEEDKARAFYWYMKSAKQGFSPAQFNVGGFYFGGDNGVKKDRAKSFYWYMKAAEQGHVKAQYNVGLQYDLGEIGDGKEQDFEKTMYWYMKAAQHGHALSQFIIGRIYDKGDDGIKQDKEKAFQWYMKAVAQGNPEALCWLEQFKKTET